MPVLESVPGRHTRTVNLRPPRGDDAIAIRDLAAATGVLDLNSTYAYLLLATDFSATSIVAETDGELRGFITGYHPPPRPNVLFVWQVAVAPAAQGTGLASAMIDNLVERVRSDSRGQPITVEATVSPGNTASRAFFGAFARRHDVPLVERPYFDSDLLDADGAHEDEPILRIGPIGVHSAVVR
ncbi:diaminobutyrate acetyltransferase [Mycolicibacterium goodii]|uniref:diaminobutyrate acetyltransferase n=1 Tax=Mycolicibacterium goodii TaxID=134601 RepID=UPI001BDC1C8C|nr:diaminobutyrate acetyltransferase [Mycolicibacterium goodii]MBU8817046.1 diaminobutyrate acetyltransferase [Mycolicibacterium goodii]